MRRCTLGSTTARSHQFLECGPSCFVRRFVVPLHQSRTDFELQNLCKGRVDVAARLIAATLVCSQRIRHNTELWLPFLGDDPPTSVCVTGGLVRGLHPSELSNATRLRQAIDALGQGGADEHTPPPSLHPDLRGFRLLNGGFAEALGEALSLARADRTRAPLLLLVQGAPPLSAVLPEIFAPCQPSIEVAPEMPRELVVVLGDHVGLSDAEIELVDRLSAEVGGGGPVLRASLADGALLASHCVVLTHHHLDAIHDCPSQLWEISPELRGHQRQRQRRMKRKNAKRERRNRAAAAGSSPEDSGDASSTDSSDSLRWVPEVEIERPHLQAS